MLELCYKVNRDEIKAVMVPGDKVASDTGEKKIFYCSIINFLKVSWGLLIFIHQTSNYR